MKRIITLITLSLAAFGGTIIPAAEYDCTLTYEGKAKVVGHDTFSTDKPFNHIELAVPAPDFRAVGTLARNEDGEYEINMGDFCGEHYHDTTLADPGAHLTSRYSYGREPGTENWRTLTLDCVRQ